MLDFINKEIQKSLSLLQQIVADPSLLQTVQKITQQCVQAISANRKILFAGNGGSATDSQHLATELVGRLRYDRPGIPALALTSDASLLTAIGNDYSFEQLFARQISTLGQEGDVFIGLTTSGKSANILKALEAARAKNMVTIGFTGQSAPMLTERCDIVLNVPSSDTQKIQECHILFGHIICGLIEEAMYGEKYRSSQVMSNVT